MVIAGLKNIDTLGNSNQEIKEVLGFIESNGAVMTCKSPLYGWLYYKKREDILVADGVHSSYINQSFVYGAEKPMILQDRVVPTITQDELLFLVEEMYHLSFTDYNSLKAFVGLSTNTIEQKIKEIQDNALNNEKVILYLGLYNGSN